MSPVSVDSAPLRGRAQERLRALAGPEAVLREDQWAAIVALVVDHRRALVVQRTGWGKSAVYFVATALLRAAGAGPTVIISPLLALMRNQIAAAERAGIHARTINSANPEDWQEVYRSVQDGEVDVLLLSPERLNNPGFREAVLPRLAATCGLLVVDEAHCISDWGHDFRPDFRRLRTLLPELPAGTPVLATTATANSRVVADVAEVLGLGEGGDVLVLRGPLDRESLHLSVVMLPDEPSRLGWLAERLGQLPGSGIVYTLTVAASQDVADYLRTHGYPVAAYSGQTDDTDRRAAEEALLANEVKALVATSALGMGFDKPDLGFVIHYGSPASPIAYYQQVGRAGRGVARAEAILLPGREDRAVWDYFASVGFPAEHHVRAALTALAEAGAPLSTPALEARVDLGRSRLETMLKVLDVDGAVRRVAGGWQATGQPWVYDAPRYRRVAEVRAAEQQAMLAYQATAGCRMQFLREQLDDPAAAPCGRCDNCRGVAPDTAVSEAAVSGARQRLQRPGVVVERRKQWPAGMAALGVELSGRIAATEAAEDGRAVARFTDLGYGPAVRALFAATSADQPVPAALVDAAVQVLAGWEWDRPAAVASVGSRNRPVLVRSLASRLAEIGQLAYLGEVPHRGASGQHRTNSPQRLKAVHDAYPVPATLRERVGSLSAPVLLVDDYVATGWTLAVVARELRLAGAARVYPFALGVQA